MNAIRHLKKKDALWTKSAGDVCNHLAANQVDEDEERSKLDSAARLRGCCKWITRESWMRMNEGLRSSAGRYQNDASLVALGRQATSCSAMETAFLPSCFKVVRKGVFAESSSRLRKYLPRDKMERYYTCKVHVHVG
ncbi:hypothetical protein B296_00026585 [Ensete ventricosum]|uniref:Uncharacterized protein n=1 Tax=Ensete ventricosum TaxID=4639 RepID=A0A427ARD6_ENSVE|nr:hypothetical protein B296_00026585 [Ensete ventricosum]